MRAIYLILFFVCLPWLGKTQERNLQQLVAKGNKAFVEFVDVKKNIPEAKEALTKILKGEEWNRWELVEKQNEADFVLKVSVEKKGMNPMSFTSDGARIRVIAEIYDLNKKLLWKSKRQQGNASVFTGFGALDDAMRKLVRRALNEELLENYTAKQ